ncbi:hypothetical protein AAGG74_17930 [Bacillus mexicanus]|uniref:hypothetical protein n=1 Tax=Bacillus mexicanus TaxID=2834415 RepID=UPI003D1AA451
MKKTTNNQVFNKELLNDLSLLMIKDIPTIARFQKNHNLQYIGETMERFDERNLVNSIQDARSFALAYHSLVFAKTISTHSGDYDITGDFYEIQKKTAFKKLYAYAKKKNDGFLQLLLYPIGVKLAEEDSVAEKYLKFVDEQIKGIIETLTGDELYLLMSSQDKYYSVQKSFEHYYEDLGLAFLDRYKVDINDHYSVLLFVQTFLNLGKPKKSLFKNKEQHIKVTLLTSMLRTETKYSDKYKDAFNWTSLDFYQLYTIFVTTNIFSNRVIDSKITHPGCERIYTNYVSEILKKDQDLPNSFFADVRNNKHSWLDKGGKLFETRLVTLAKLIPAIPNENNRNTIISITEEVLDISFADYLEVEKLYDYYNCDIFNDEQKKEIFNYMISTIEEQPFFDNGIPLELAQELESKRLEYDLRIGFYSVYFKELLRLKIYSPENTNFFINENYVSWLFDYLSETSSPDIDAYLEMYPLDIVRSQIEIRFLYLKSLDRLTYSICSLYLDAIENRSNYVDELIKLLLNDHFVETAGISQDQRSESLWYLADSGWMDDSTKEEVIQLFGSEEQLRKLKLDKEITNFKKQFNSAYVLKSYSKLFKEHLELIKAIPELRSYILKNLSAQHHKAELKLLYARECLHFILSNDELIKWNTIIEEKLIELDESFVELRKSSIKSNITKIKNEMMKGAF